MKAKENKYINAYHIKTKVESNIKFCDTQMKKIELFIQITLEKQNNQEYSIRRPREMDLSVYKRKIEKSTTGASLRNKNKKGGR